MNTNPAYYLTKGNSTPNTPLGANRRKYTANKLKHLTILTIIIVTCFRCSFNLSVSQHFDTPSVSGANVVTGSSILNNGQTVYLSFT
jgi:hypothetical protein